MTTRSRRVRHRRGVSSLIECVLVIGSMTAIFAIVGGFLHMLLRLDKAGRGAVADAGVVSRLSHQFREDVRGARTARLGALADGLELTRPDGSTVRYDLERRRLVRVESAPKRREAYDLERLGPPRFGRDGAFVVLALERRPAGVEAPGRDGYRLEARLGKDEAREEAPR